MKLSKEKLALIIKEEYQKIREQDEEPIQFNPAVTIGLIIKDDFLEQAFDDEEGSVAERLEFVFDEFIYGDAEQERAYRKEIESLLTQLNPTEEQ